MAWTSQGNIRGPAGPAGATGPTGATGATGATGPAGSNANVTAHEAASDPHPQYLTPAEGNAAYVQLTDTRVTVVPYAPVTLTDAATIATNAALGTRFRVALTNNRTLGAPTNPTDGQVCTWEITASGAARTLTLTTGSAGAFLFGTDIPALTATASGATDLIQATYRSSASRWWVTGYVKGF